MGFEKNGQLQSWLELNPQAIGFAFLGRSNVGKSSLINSLFGKKTARVSNTPGRTQQINIFEFEIYGIDNVFYLFDVPGYGHANVSQRTMKNWNQLMDTFFQLISPLVLLINIQDARHPYQKADQHFLSYIKQLPHESYLVLNKIDKLKKQSEKAKLKLQVKELLPEFKMLKQIFELSALSKKGVDKLEESLYQYLEKKMLAISET